MTAQHTFTFVTNPAGPVYDELLAAGLHGASELCLMMQPRKNTSSQCRAVLARLESFLARAEDISAWPGSQLHSGYFSTRYVYAVNDQVIDIVRAAADSLFDWINPDLPEDPHFLRADGATWLGSTTHEEYAWLELSDLEWVDLSARWSELAGALRPE